MTEQDQHIEKLLRDAARRCAGQYIMPVNAGDLSLSELMMMAADLLEVRRDENGLEITREMISAGVEALETYRDSFPDAQLVCLRYRTHAVPRRHEQARV